MRRKAKKGIRIFISFLSILVIGVICFASYYILHTLGFLSKIKNVNYKLENYSVIVLKDSKYEKIEDIDSLDVGYYGNSTGAADANKKIFEAIKELGTGQALVSFQTEQGEPSIVEKVKILPPQSRMGTITDSEREQIIKSGRLYGKYDNLIDDHSASEKIKAKREEAAKIEEERLSKIQQEKEEAEAQKQAEKEEKERIKQEKEEQKAAEKAKREAEKAKKNDPLYKIGKKAENKAVNKLLDKGLNKLFKKFFK